MTGTAETEAKEFWDIYKLDVVVIPSNRPIIRKDQNDYVFKSAREKFNAVIEEIEKLVEEGRNLESEYYLSNEEVENIFDIIENIEDIEY